MKAYSEALSHRIVHAVETGMPPAEVAGLFMVSERTIKRYPRRWQPTRTLAPGVSPGDRAGSHRRTMRAWAHVAAAPDATLAVQRARWEALIEVREVHPDQLFLRRVRCHDQ